MKIGTYAVEQDYSHYVKQLNKTVLAVLGTATKGEVGVPTLCTSPQDLVTKFGLPRAIEATEDTGAQIDYGLYAAMYFLSQSSKLYFVRVSDASETEDDAVTYGTAADTLLSEYIDINMIATPGESEYTTITKMIHTAEKRGDCLYLVDPPAGKTKEEIKTWLESYYESAESASAGLDPKLDLSYGALYYDWAVLYDSFTKKNVTVPPSVYVAMTYARSDKMADVWYAPAGLTRGKVNGVREIITPISKKDAEDLYAANINPLYNDPQAGLVLWGQKTLQKETTALDRINVRRLMNYLKKVITAACNYLTFEPNDRTTWNSFELKVKPILENVKTKRGIYEYRIIQGEAIVTDNDIDNYRMPCMVLIRPTKAAEEIPIYFTITNTGADFNDVLDANGIITETN